MSAPHPRPHQAAALEALAAARRRGAVRALAVMASGLGKTLLSAFDHRQLEQELGRRLRLLYLTERNVILDQAERSYEWLAEGEERSTGQYNANRKELQADLVFATFQSLHPIVGVLDPQTWDMIVVDEAHHTAAVTHEAVVSHLRPAWTLGLTATSFRGDGKDIGAYYNDEVPVSLPLERALVEGLLTPIDYRVWTDALDASTLERTLKISARGIHSEGFAKRNDQTIVNTVLDESLDADGQRRVVVFCASLTQMRHFASLFPSCRTISGEDGPVQQAQILRDFEAGKFEILLSRDVLNEGADMPHATTLVFLRNTESAVVFLQQMGRGLRRSPGKDRVRVLDFVDNAARIEFVYGFYSRLQAEEERARERGDTRPPTSALHLDDAAKDVIRVLLAKKRAAEFLVDLEGLQAAVDFSVGKGTLRRMVADRRLTPDFVDPDGSEMLFERHTVLAWLRAVHSPRASEGLVHERDFARATGRNVPALRRAVERDGVIAAWVHRKPAGGHELFFDVDDLSGRYLS